MKIRKFFGVAAIAAALTVAVAAPANAASSTGMVKGPLVFQFSQDTYLALAAPSGPGLAEGIFGDSVAGLSGSAAIVNMPAKGETGPIRSASNPDLCLAVQPTSNKILWAACDQDDDLQKFTTRQVGPTIAGLSGWTFGSVRNDGTSISPVDNRAAIAEDPGSEPSHFRLQVSIASVTLPEYENFSTGVAPLTVVVDSVDDAAGTASLSGTGEPGAAISISTPAGTTATTVSTDGTWSATVSAQSGATVTVTQTITADVQTVEMTLTVLPAPIVNPTVAAVVGLVGVGAIATVAAIRRRAVRA